MQMRAGLRMHEQVVGARIDECLDERINRGDHQMYVERQSGPRPQALQDRWAEADVRYKVAVHHIEMKPIRPSRFDGGDLLVQASEICGEQAWCDSDSSGSRHRHGTDVGRHAGERQAGTRYDLISRAMKKPSIPPLSAHRHGSVRKNPSLDTASASHGASVTANGSGRRPPRATALSIRGAASSGCSEHTA